MHHEPHHEGAEDAERAVTRRGRILALLGLGPFLILSAWLFGIADDHPWRADTIQLLKVYAAIVLSFLGGIRWGLSMRSRSSTAARDIAASCLPALAGWAAVFAPVPVAFALLAVAFAAQGAWDNFAVHRGDAPRWFGRIRMLATMVAVAAMLVAFAATA